MVTRKNLQDWQFKELPAHLVLLPNEIHLWWVELTLPSDVMPSLFLSLSEDEQLRAERFRMEEHRRRFIAGRGILRTLLGRYLHRVAADLQFEYGSYGKPNLIKAQNSAAIHFNVSHSDNLALYAITSDRAVGVDLEQFRLLPNLLQLSQRFFSKNEYQALNTLSSVQQHDLFFRLWTSKEAYLKATGEGLGALSQVEVSVGREEPEVSLTVTGDPDAGSRWAIWQLDAPANYAAAIAVEGHDCQLTHFSLRS